MCAAVTSAALLLIFWPSALNLHPHSPTADHCCCCYNLLPLCVCIIAPGIPRAVWLAGGSPSHEQLPGC